MSSSIDYGASDFVTTPTTTAISFALWPYITLSGGVFTMGSDVRAASGVKEVTAADGSTLSQKLDLLVHQRKMSFGGALGIDAGHGFRIGGGGFVISTVQDSAVGYLFGVKSASSVEGLASLMSNQSSSAWGFQPSFGAQWDASKRLHFGVLYQFSELRVLATGTDSTTQVLAGDSASYQLTHDTIDAKRMRWASPARLTAGVAYEPSRLVRLALDADLSFGLTADSFGMAQKPMPRARLGVLYKPWDFLHLGTGLFTDPSAARRLADSVGAIRADFYGATAGVILRTRLGEVAAKDPPVLTLSLALRYALGHGQARTLVIDEAALRASTHDIVIHDIMPYVGSSIAF